MSDANMSTLMKTHLNPPNSITLEKSLWYLPFKDFQPGFDHGTSALTTCMGFSKFQRQMIMKKLKLRFNTLYPKHFN